MMYRKYKLVLAGLICIVTVGLVGCAGPGGKYRMPNSLEDYDGNEPVAPHKVSRKADFGWIDNVQEDFGKVAARSSNRSLASQDNQVLVKKNNFSFFYQKTNNQFFLSLNGQTYRMIQTNLGESGHYAFAAEGSENPPSFSVHSANGNRGPASTFHCNVALSYFNQGQNAYAQDQVKIGPKSCVSLTKILKDYVP